MITVTVHLHTILQRQTPAGLIKRLEVELPPGNSLEDLLTALDIRMSYDSLLLVVNGRLVESGRILQHGDEVNLMPAISGGGTSERSAGVNEEVLD